jgi:hypothetical protein
MNRQTIQPYLLILIAILLVAALFRVVNIQNVPPAFFPDEANMALDAQSIMQGHLYLVTPHEGGEGALYAYLLALTFALFGAGILQARLLTAAVSVVSVGVAFVFLHRLLLTRLGTRPALAVSAFAGVGLSVVDWYVAVSRQAFPQPLAVLMQLSCLAAVWWMLHSARRTAVLLAGVSLGLTAYTYVPGKLTPFVLLLYFLLDWAARRRESFLVRYFWRLVAVAAIGGVLYVPLVAAFTLRAGEMGGRAAQFTVFSPAVNQGDVWSALLRSGLGNVAGFLPFLIQVGGHPIVKALDDLSAVLFLVGLIVMIWRWRRPEFLLLVVWWFVMLVPSIIAPEGSVPHLRRAIGTVVPTFALVGVGLVMPLAAMAQRQTGWRRRSAVGVGLVVVLLSVSVLARHTYVDYYLYTQSSETVALTNHIYDFELADVMAAEGDESTGYLLPVDSASGALFPESSTLAFLYRGKAAYAYIWDDETKLPAALQRLAEGKTRIGVVHWKVSKHTGADPKGVVKYYLEKWGHWGDTRSYTYFDIDTYQLDNASDAFTSVPLTRLNVGFEGQMALTGYAYGPKRTATVGDFLWTELTWRKTGDTPADYQVALWLEDEAGHVVGRLDKPLLNNLRHQGTSRWAVGEEERDYYLVPIDATTPPGTYRLKVVLYIGDGDGRRLAPLLSGVGADLAVTLGSATAHAPFAPPDVVTLSIPNRLDLDVGGGLRLLGFDSGFAGPLRPGSRAALSLWWQATQPLSQNLAVAVGIGHGERAWPLNKQPQPLGGSNYPSRDWPAGTVIRTFVDLRVPADVEAGKLNLGLRLVNAESGASLSDWLLGQVDVAVRTRSFEAPTMMYSLGANFGNQATLLGYDLDLTNFKVDSPVQLTLYWQAQKGMDTAYRVFVHLLEPTGGIVVQMDQEPQAGDAPTTGWLAGEVVKDDIVMKVSGAATTAHEIAIGLYDPATGTRVPVLDASGAVIGDSVTFLVK